MQDATAQLNLSVTISSVRPQKQLQPFAEP